MIPPGLPVAKMTSSQKDALWNLIADYAHRHRAEVAEADLKKIQAAGFKKVHFAWAGGLEPGEGFEEGVQLHIILKIDFALRV